MEKVPFRITAKKSGKVAKINIVGEIGWQVDSSKFRAEVDNLIKEGCTEARLYINSIGGSCFDANEIVNILTESFKKLDGDGGAIVASAASFIAAHCETFTMPTNGQFMIHRPNGGAYGTLKDIEAYLKLISDMDADYLAAFKAKATNPEDIEKRWNSGSDYWMNANDAKDAGFVTSIREKVKPDQETTSMLRASASDTAKERMSEFLINNDNDTTMELLAKALNLSAKATEQEMVDALTPILSENKTLKIDLKKEQDEKKILQDRLDGIEAAEKEAKTQEAKALIAAAIKDGRLDDDEEHASEKFWLRNFETDFVGSKAQIEKLPKKTNLSERIENKGGESAWDKRQKEIEENNKK